MTIFWIWDYFLKCHFFLSKYFFKEELKCSDPKAISQMYFMILQNLNSKIALIQKNKQTNKQKTSNMDHSKGSTMFSGAGRLANLWLCHCFPFFSIQHYEKVSREGKKNNHWSQTLNDGRHSLMKEKWRDDPRQTSVVWATAGLNRGVCATKWQRLKPTNPMRSIAVSVFVSFKHKWRT